MKYQFAIAVEYALKAHAGQKYGESDYSYHLHQVDQMVVKMYKPKGLSSDAPYSKEPGDEIDNLRAIAWGHDILEDTPTTTLDLHNAGLSDTVINAICAITKWEDLSYEEYIAHVKTNPLALKVKLCDTSANLWNSIMEGNVKRINKYTKQIQLLGGFQ